MKVLVAGFEAGERERISSELQADGHHVLCVGVDLAVAMAPGFGPDEVIIPSGSQGEAAERALAAVLKGVPFTTGGDLPAPVPQPVAEVVVDVPVVTPAAVLASVAMMPAEPVHDVVDFDESSSPIAEPPRPSSEKDRPSRAPRTSLTAPDMAAKLEHVRFGDYHCILEVTPEASAFLVREHYEALSRLYNPAGWPHRLTPDEVHILAEIGEGIREAFTILGHHELRARYERALARQAR